MGLHVHHNFFCLYFCQTLQKLYFAELTREQKRVLQTNSNAVRKVFNYHVVKGKYDTNLLKGDQDLQPAQQNGGRVTSSYYCLV